ncbi:MAG: antibiotic biosynthesis monooxygenase [Deltaproteobacteria bacterium]|nr:antibiotic biosynthesis monooxygenase [Deltaproteobacteria bacterium]
MIIVEMHLNVTPQERMNVLSLIHSMVGPTSVKTGCLFCGFFSSTQNDDELILLEKWESEAELERHIRSDDFQKVLAAVDIAKMLPEISFNKVSSTEGMDFVEKIRE